MGAGNYQNYQKDQDNEENKETDNKENKETDNKEKDNEEKKDKERTPDRYTKTQIGDRGGFNPKMWYEYDVIYCLIDNDFWSWCHNFMYLGNAIMDKNKVTDFMKSRMEQDRQQEYYMTAIETFRIKSRKNTDKVYLPLIRGDRQPKGNKKISWNKPYWAVHDNEKRRITSMDFKFWLLDHNFQVAPDDKLLEPDSCLVVK